MPCRFTGVDSFNLCGDDGVWMATYERDLFAYDAGTDSGVSFASENEETTPREPITAFSEVSPQSDSIFYNPEECATTLVVRLPVATTHQFTCIFTLLAIFRFFVALCQFD